MLRENGRLRLRPTTHFSSLCHVLSPYHPSVTLGLSAEEIKASVWSEWRQLAESQHSSHTHPTSLLPLSYHLTMADAAAPTAALRRRYRGGSLARRWRGHADVRQSQMVHHGAAHTHLLDEEHGRHAAGASFERLAKELVAYRLASHARGHTTARASACALYHIPAQYPSPLTSTTQQAAEAAEWNICMSASRSGDTGRTDAGMNHEAARYPW